MTINDHDPDTMPWWFWLLLIAVTFTVIALVAWSGVAG